MVSNSFPTLCSSAYYFDSFGTPAYISTIQDFIRRNCNLCHYNTVRLQGLASPVCGHYCCLFALYQDRATPHSSSSDSSVLTSQTSSSNSYLHLNSDHYPVYIAEGKAVPPCIKGKSSKCSESYVELLILNLVLNPSSFLCTGNSQPLTAGSAITDSTFPSCEWPSPAGNADSSLHLEICLTC
jgi:hypothetical protein